MYLVERFTTAHSVFITKDDFRLSLESSVGRPVWRRAAPYEGAGLGRLNEYYFRVP